MGAETCNIDLFIIQKLYHICKICQIGNDCNVLDRAHLCGHVNFSMQSVQESFLYRKRSNGYDAFKKFIKARENRRSGVRLHPSEIAPCVEIANRKHVVNGADSTCWQKENWEKICDCEDRCDECGHRGVDSLQRTRERRVHSLNVLDIRSEY